MKKTKAKTAANAPEPRVRRPQPVYDGFKDYKAWATEAMEDGGLIRSADRRSQMVGEAWDEYPTEARDQFGIGFKKFTQAKGFGFDATNPLYINDPLRTLDMGTTGWMAPEQLPNRHHPVTPATNVYQIGLLVFELMTLQIPTHQVEFDVNQGRPFPAIDGGFYPEGLVELATECTEREPQNRPSPEAVYSSIRGLTTEYPSWEPHSVPWQFQRVPSGQFVRAGEKAHVF